MPRGMHRPSQSQRSERTDDDILERRVTEPVSIQYLAMERPRSIVGQRLESFGAPMKEISEHSYLPLPTNSGLGSKNASQSSGG